jgi:hypothetical protein
VRWWGLWFLIGFFLGPIGLVASAGLPDRTLRHYIRCLAFERGIKEEELGEDPVLCSLLTRKNK